MWFHLKLMCRDEGPGFDLDQTVADEGPDHVSLCAKLSVLDLNQGQSAPIRQTRSCSPGAAGMIICSCNVLSGRDVRAVVNVPRTSMAQVYQRLGHEPQCGRCACTIRQIMDEQRQVADD